MKVLIACGGTAGHIFPGLALAEELKRDGKDVQTVIVLSTHPRDKKYLKKEDLANFSIEVVSTLALPFGFSFKYIISGLKLIWACGQSLYIILKHRPDVVVGFGGYAAFAPLILARLMRIPALIHEQNLVPGRANRILAAGVDKIAVSFDETKKLFPQKEKILRKIVVTGLPLRRQILNGPQTEKEKTAGVTILAFGGSQGAHSVNNLLLDCLSRVDKEKRAFLQTIHVSGKKDFAYVKQRYENLNINSRVFDFLEDMEEAYRSADLLIGRSGASTIFEAAFFGLPSILIPYSYAGRHQKENALYLKHRGAALVLDEQTASAEDLKKILLELVQNQTLRENLSQKIKTLKITQAAHNLKEQVMTLSRGHNVER